MSISNQRTHILTPTRKRTGKSIAQKSNKAVVDECMKLEGIRKYILQCFGVLLRCELKTVCSENVNPVLNHKLEPEHDLFGWDALHLELSIHASLLLRAGFLLNAFKLITNRTAVIGMCCSILLKFI